MRLSPTWPYVNRASSAATSVATTVVPMPAYSSSAAARVKIARFASLIAVRMRLASKDRLGSNPYGQVRSGSAPDPLMKPAIVRSEEHTSELQSRPHLVCRLLLEKKKK